MTTKDLGDFLKEHLVPKKLYSLKGGQKNRICLEKENDHWNVYFKERHEKVGVMTFRTENEACRRMLKEIGKVMEFVYGLKFTGLMTK